MHDANKLFVLLYLQLSCFYTLLSISIFLIIISLLVLPLLFSCFRGSLCKRCCCASFVWSIFMFNGNKLRPWSQHTGGIATYIHGLGWWIFFSCLNCCPLKEEPLAFIASWGDGWKRMICWIYCFPLCISGMLCTAILIELSIA